MRIAYLAGRRLPSRQANAVQITGMCAAFAAEGHEVTLYGRSGDAPVATLYARYGLAPDFAVAVLHPRMQPFHKLLFPRALRRRLAAGTRPDLFYARDPAWLAAVADMGVPMVFEAHQAYPAGSYRSRLLRRLFAHRAFARLVCVASPLIAAYQARYAALRDAPVLLAPVAAAARPPAPPIMPWPGRAGACQVGFIGQAYPGKGIEAMAGAARLLPDVDFHIVGADRAAVRGLAGALPANLHAHGYRPHAALGGYHARFDIAAAPYGAQVSNASGIESAAYTSPLKIADYLAAGLAVVASDLPGVRDLLAGTDAALRVPPGDVRAFVAAIARLRDDPAQRDVLRAAARGWFDLHGSARARARTVLAGL